MIVKLYQTGRIIALCILAGFLAMAVIYEVTADQSAEYEKDPALNSLIRGYQSIKSFALTDPYYQNVQEQVDQARENLEKNFTSIAAKMGKLVEDPEFTNQLFVFLVSKKVDGIEKLVRSSMSDEPLFRDLLIVDRNRNVLYKYGNSPLTPDFFPTSNRFDVVEQPGEPILIQTYRDNTLDYEVELLGLYDWNSLSMVQKKLPYASAVIYGKNVYSHGSVPRLDEFAQNPASERTLHSGLQLMESSRILYQGKPIATMVLAYPARSVGSHFLLLIKVLVLVLVVIGLIGLDRFIIKKLIKDDAWKKTLKEKPSAVREETPEEAAIEESSLEWFEKYVEGNEDKK